MGDDILTLACPTPAQMKAIRAYLGITVREAGSLSGVSYSAINDYEIQKRATSADTKTMLAIWTKKLRKKGVRLHADGALELSP